MTRAGVHRGRTGQPLAAIGVVLLGWIAVRAVLIEVPHPVLPEAPTIHREIMRLVRGSGLPPVAQAHVRRSEPPVPQAAAHALPQLPRLAPARPSLPPMAPPFQLWAPSPPQVPTKLAPPTPGVAAVPTRTAAAHALLWMAAMTALPLTPELRAALLPARAPQPSRQASAGPRKSGWSADGWLVWRSGASPLIAGGAAAPSYGGSQAGAVLRYALAPQSSLRPQAYVRGASALGQQAERQLAAGLAIRLIPALPVTLHGEARLTDRASGSEIRPAAFLSGGVDGVPAAGGALMLRGYAQGGYVGGRDATFFADGSFHLERALTRDRNGDRQVLVGGGAWGGAQQGAARLDLGPSASLRFKLGDGAARVSADYRLRVAGNAEPASGAALTLSAGF